MSERDDEDGGPAFPRTDAKSYDTGEIFWPPQDGMSLRDWFAGQALVIVAGYPAAREEAMADHDVARWAYQLADAMLAARKQVASNPGEERR